MDFSKFDELIDLDALRHEVEKAASSTGEYEEVPIGQYEVRIEHMELKESKKGKPMVSVWFKIIAGEYDGSMIFMNQVVEKPVQIHICNQFLRSLKTDVDIDFKSYSNYADTIAKVYESVGVKEYALDYGENRGYKTFTITQVFE